MVRIINKNEVMRDVMMEAIKSQAYVWAKPEQQQAVIARHCPGTGWTKVHAVEVSQ